MKTIEWTAGRNGARPAAQWMAAAAMMAGLALPGAATADEPAKGPAAAETAKPKPARAQAIPAPLVSIRHEKAVAAAKAAQAEQTAFITRVGGSGLCEGPEIARYGEAQLLQDLGDTAKKRRAEIERLSKKWNVTVAIPTEAAVARAAGTTALDEAEKALRKGVEDIRKTAKKDFLKEASNKLTTGTQTCDEACAEKAFQVCTHATARLAEAETGALPGAADLASFQTSLVTGLAKFLQTRAEAELTTWLLTQVKDDLCASEGKTWLPATCALFDETSGYAVSSATSLLAAAVRKDIERLPARVLVVTAGLDERLADVLVDTLWKMRDGQKPLELLAGIGKNEFVKEVCGAGSDVSNMLACVLVAAGYAVEHSRDALREGFEANLPGLVADLLAEMNVHLPAKGAASSLTAKNVEALLRAIQTLQSSLEQAPSPGSTPIERGGVALRLSVDILDAAVALLGNEDVLVRWGAVSHGMTGASEILQGHPVEALRELVLLAREAKKILPGNVAKHLALIADLATAKDASEVQSILESAAAPIGSYLEKRKGPMLSATGLVGLSVGGEFPVDWGTKRWERKPTMAFSPMAAVGLDLSFPCGTSTVGAFLSLLDVGQLLSLPFVNPSGAPEKGTDQAPAVNNEVQIAQVISPGLFFRVGIAKTPLTWGLGASYAPQLRTYVERDLKTRDEVGRALFDVVRVQTFLSVDVTLLPLTRF